MPRIKMVEVTAEQKAALEKGVKYGSTPSFRLRCQAILLKDQDGQNGQKRTSLDVARELGCCEMSVNDWMKRFVEQGVDGLKVAKGRGRPSILQTENDLEIVRRAVQNHRQRISLAKADLEKELGKEFSHLTLKRFLKKTVALAHTCAIQTTSAGNEEKAQPRRLRFEARLSFRVGSVVGAG